MSTFAKNFRQTASGSKRMLIVLGVVALVAVGLVWANSGGMNVPNSQVNGPVQTLRTVQAKQQVSQEYDAQLSKADQQRAKEAADTGKSAMPTMRYQNNLMAGLPAEPAAPAQDLSKLPRPQPPQVIRPEVANLPPPPVQAVSMKAQENPLQVEATNAMYRGALAGLDKRTFAPAAVQYFYKGTAAGASSNAAGQQAQSATGSGSSTGNIGGIPLPLPGTILYAELVGEANSDAPGPILAKVLQGPLSGATLIGSFGAQRDTLILKFSTLTLGTSAAGDEIDKTVPVTAVGVDSANVGPGIATDVDHHFIANVGFTAAAAFAQGFAGALSQSGSTVSQSAYGSTYSFASRGLSDNLRIGGATGVAAGAQALVQAYGNRPVTIKIAAGTPIGVMFLPSNVNGN